MTVSFTCRFTSVDPVWVRDARYGKDIRCQKQAARNDGEFIHIVLRSSQRCEENMLVAARMRPRVLRDTGWLLSV